MSTVGLNLCSRPNRFEEQSVYILIGLSVSNTTCYSLSQIPCYILICPIAESHIVSWISVVKLSFLGDLFASRRWSRERDIYRTHKLLYFLDHRPPKLTLRVWNVLMLLTYTLSSLVRSFLQNKKTHKFV